MNLNIIRFSQNKRNNTLAVTITNKEEALET